MATDMRIFLAMLVSCIAFCGCSGNSSGPASRRPIAIEMDEGLSDKSEIVVLANVLENHGGSKYSWYAAQLVREIRNPEKLKLRRVWISRYSIRIIDFS